MSQPRPTHHLCHKLRHNASTLPHFALNIVILIIILVYKVFIISLQTLQQGQFMEIYFETKYTFQNLEVRGLYRGSRGANLRARVHIGPSPKNNDAESLSSRKISLK